MKIYVDAGHRNNASDFGANWGNRKESEDCVGFAQLLACNLKALGVEVKLSRDSEKTCKSLTARTKEANNWGADLYLSIHRNASASHKGYGAETLIYSLDPKNKKVADELQNVMFTVGNFANRGIKTRPDLHVLKATKMIAVLLEIGFIDNTGDNEKFDKNKLKLASELAQVLHELLQ